MVQVMECALQVIIIRINYGKHPVLLEVLHQTPRNYENLHIDPLGLTPFILPLKGARAKQVF